MKFTAAIVALASVAAAAPGADTASNYKCTPATYRCIPGYGTQGWEVCNTSGQFVFAGNCPPKTICKFNDENQSPYCVPPKFQFP